MELGLGNYHDPIQKLGHGEAIILNIKTDKSNKIPLDLQYYRISPQFVNVTGNFLNTSVLEVFLTLRGWHNYKNSLSKSNGWTWIPS